MLTYDLEDRGGLARYDYLYRCIREDILSGRLEAGEKLPSRRALARHLHTAVATVENAYAQLEAEGYLTARQRRGWFVCPVQARPAPSPILWEEEEEGEEEWLLDLQGGGVAGEGFPFSLWARLMRRVLTEEGEGLLRPVPHSGVLPLRRAIARHLYRFRGISAAPGQIVVGAGAEYCYNLIVQLLGRELVYGVEDPGYPKAARVYQLSGAPMACLPVGEQGVGPDQVARSGAQVLHLSPNHQFPTGAVTPIGLRQGLLGWAEEGEERYILEDDYDSEFPFAPRPIPTLQSIDRKGRVIYMNTFSRTLSPSLRISYLVLPRPLLERYRSRLGFYSCTVPALEQYTLARFLEEGHFEAHLNRMRVYYRARRDQVLRAIQASPLAGRCRSRGEGAGLHFLLQLDTARSDEELGLLARERGLRLSFLSHYERQKNSAPQHTLVVSYPRVDPAGLDRGLEVLAGLL